MDLFALHAFVVRKIPGSPKSWLMPKSSLIIVALAAGCAPLIAQQPYSPYAAGQGVAGQGQYASPNQPYNYAQQPYYGQQQYSQPQYGQPQYAQPQYQEPQLYAQPQYPQQYAQPQAMPYAQQPAVPQQYGPEQQGPEPQGPDQQQGYQQSQPPLNADELEQLVAPIALYPDQLLAEILTASTYPAQVAVASQWLQQMQSQGAASPDQIADAADTQSNWDPSVKALTAFPQVMDMMDRNLEWTTNLGNAYYNQPQDVMQTIQVMRQRAEDAGNLQSTAQEQMTYSQGSIELAPANPQMAYVPIYNPWDVYGQPVSPYPGFSLIGALGSFFGSAPIHYGLGIGMAAFGHTPFGLVAWGLDWLAHSVLFQHNDYFTHSTTVADWGFPRGGPRAYGGWARDPRFAGIGRTNQDYSRNSYGNVRPAQQFERPGQQFSRPEQQSARPAQQFAQPEQSFARPAQSFTRPSEQFARPGEGASGYQRGENFDRGYRAQGYGAARPAMPTQQAYNRMPQPISRPQSYASSPQAFNYANRPAQTYAARPNPAYASPYQSFRAPQATAPRAFAQAPSRGFSSFAAAPQRSNSFRNFSNEKAPRSFSSGGDHFKAPKAPKESHSSGGGGGKHRR